VTNSAIHIPEPTNEPLSYAPGTPERKALKAQLKEMLKRDRGSDPHGGKEIRTGDSGDIRVRTTMGTSWPLPQGEREIVAQAEKAATAAWKEWSVLDWRARASIFLKMADLLAGKHRMILNASTMLGQSKTPHQAEIDSAAELVDFYRFNTYYMQQIYSQQPISDRDVELRRVPALEGSSCSDALQSPRSGNPDEPALWETPLFGLTAVYPAIT
jgi:1-pyrroline-5-carboxylate dehydrogenase